jgi:hypothetical protein
MDDLRERLDLLADRVPDQAQPFEGLTTLRRRRMRRRRIVAGSLALAVGAAGSLIAGATFRERHVVPIVPATPSRVPDVAVITCDGRGTSIDIGTVAARPDGVHVQVTNTTDHTLAFAASDTDEFHDVHPGTSTFVESFFFSPGSHFVACGPRGHLPGGFTEQIQVLDPEGVWTPTDLACVGSTQWGSDLRAEGNADPLIVARRAFGDRIHDGDELRFAGYPSSPSRRVVLLVRNGKAIAEVWEEMQDGAWVGTLMNGCP